MPTSRYNLPQIRLGGLALTLIIGAFTFQSKLVPVDPLPVGSKWFPQYDFDPVTFQKPPLTFGPYARWWWPGNDVTKPELQREINLFADHSFGGVEVQTLALGLPRSSPELSAKIMTWDTPEYYENLKTVMEEARKRGLTVDLTDGSGWPPGGPFLDPQDGFLTLQAASQDIKGGRMISLPLPTIPGKLGVIPHLEAVLAAKIVASRPGDNEKTTALDSAAPMVLTGQVRNDTLHCQLPAGDWKLIALWSRPSGQRTMTAGPTQGPVVDHFDSVKVIKNYRHVIGPRTGLEPYYGNPLRAIFNDSYEFEVDRHYSPDFIAYFKRKRGYDITPWLPANLQKGYNYASYKRPNAPLEFSFGSEDWRLRYDYDRTIGELLGEHFIKTSSSYLEKRGMLHRTQVYGMNMDMMANAGLASIPETESMLGPEAILKVMASGAHLYNRPILSAESVVFINRAYTTTPQKIRLAVDKLFAAGVNQIIYHGVPYRYTPKEFSPEGWYPFSSPYLGAVNFSSHLGEGSTYWKFQKDINEYIRRTQYALRAGKPHTDVLIYFPFTNVDGMPDNPEEILTKGYSPGVEAPLPATKEPHDMAKSTWAEHVYPLINQLEANGISWGWVNDASLQQAQLDPHKQITIRGNRYQALIIADSSTIQLQTAQQINTLAVKGMKLLAVGKLPTKQPSFLNWQINDQKTTQLIVTAIKQKNSRHISQATDAGSWIQPLSQPVKFNGTFGFTRQMKRDMSDGSRVQFLWNKSDQWQTISLSLDKKYTGSYWLNAENGTITKNSSPALTYRIAPYSSVILYASTKKTVPANMVSAPPVLADGATEIRQLTTWSIQADSLTIKDSPLFDWKTREEVKFSSAVGIYTSSFQLDVKKTAAHYFLDLGKVYFTAEVTINGKSAGQRLSAPYQLDITSFVQPGTNQIQVRVTPTELNGFIGKASTGDKRYSQFKNKTDQLMSAGLVGPVKLLLLTQ
ncbi:glycosyl hydrolase family 2 [Spirosoma sp. HMF4905]|uniref:Glycosyl hydrolase family 2 n=1 Tax=Spirosoma arboris TaxID=2682092 RepID=A0A7K1S4V9_9BACT|nr:glycosyl hydrolase [Spirosoma arboris]MVM28834.1 glycosyl hydrolase family 2 [Spirosoma arboris]